MHAGARQSQSQDYQVPISYPNPQYANNINLHFEESGKQSYAPVVQNPPAHQAKMQHNDQKPYQPVPVVQNPDQKPHVTHIDIVPNVQEGADVNLGMTRDSLRRNFIKKVLVILMIQLIISTIAIALTFSDNIGWRKFLRDHQYGLWIALAVSIAVILILACSRQACRRVPLNYILLTLYTLSTSYLLASIAAATKSTIVIFAGGFTLFAVFAISLYAWRAKKDLTKRMSFIVVLTSMLLMLLIFGLIFRSHIVNVVISAAIGLVFGVLLAIDVQRLSGKYAREYSLDDYIIAALDLYIDIVQIFLAVLGVSRAASN